VLNDINYNTSEIADNINVSNENLKYLRDLAEQEVVNRFTRAEIKVDMTNNNNISSGMDIDGIVEQLTIGVQEAMTVAAEGV
jgi:orotate phosphoribosyltransferase-like protein